MDNSYIIDIQNEYSKIDNKWLDLHYKISISLVIFAFFVECIIGWLVCTSYILNTTIPKYILKFIVAPTSINTLCIFIEYKVMHSIRMSQERKTYSISLLFVVICFILFTAHVGFSAVYFIFMFPLLLTMVYADYRLTTITFILSMVSAIVSELFLKWDIDKVNIMDNAMRLGDFLIFLFLLTAFWSISMIVIRFERKKNEASILVETERIQLLKKLNIDMLTGINNRFAFRNSVKDMEEDDSNNSYTFAIIDIDNFKKLNDTYGHLMGDHCLIEFGKILKENCVESVPFRYGGDEFCILFRNYTMEMVVKTCEQIQNDLKKIIVNSKSEVHVTASFGVSTYTKGMVISKMITNADNALYEAKKTKDIICIHNE